MGASLVTHRLPPRTGGQHRKPPQRRRRPISIGIAAAAIVGSLLATVGASSAMPPNPSARQQESSARTLVGQPAPARRQNAIEPVSATAIDAFAFDQQGFLGSPARCQDTETARAIGRTESSLIVICQDRSGELEYRGVRLSDDAALATAADTVPGRRFVARNRSVSYAVSPTELLVTKDESLIKQERMVEYREILSAPVVVTPRRPGLSP
jgi:hypothetical protein